MMREHHTHDSLQTFLKEAAERLKEHSCTFKAAAAIDTLANTVGQPFNVAVVGRMKAGKSTLINSLIEKKLAISGVEEATATINVITYGTEAQENEFLVYWKDGTVESRPLGDLSEWTGKTPEVLERIQKTSHLKLHCSAAKLNHVQIIDTPGTGSAAQEHEIAQDFLRPEIIEASKVEAEKADAIVYVVPPVGRESDEDLLNMFAESRMPGSSAYNSVCVMHKWDALQVEDVFENVRDKARRLKGQLGDSVADVIPVSAPLSLMATTNSDDFFAKLIKIIQDTPIKDLEMAMKVDVLWNRDLNRKEIKVESDAPWASLKLAIRLLKKHEVTSVHAARALLQEASGIPRLDLFLNEHFFSKSAILKQFHLLQSASLALEPALKKLEAVADENRQDNVFYQKLLDSSDTIFHAWAASKFEVSDKVAAASERVALDIDREWQKRKHELSDLSFDLKLLEMLHLQNGHFKVEHRVLLRDLLNLAARGEVSKYKSHPVFGSLRQVEELIDYYRVEGHYASRKEKPVFEHIVRRLETVIQLLGV